MDLTPVFTVMLLAFVTYEHVEIIWNPMLR